MKKRFYALALLGLTASLTVVGLGTSANEAILTSSGQYVAQAATTTAQNKQIQTKLKKWGYYTGAIDGIYGAKTKRAVRYFQSKNVLTVDGIVGKKTAAAMGINLGTTSTTKTTSNTSSSDLNLLARCVYAEARGEPYTGQVAIAAVVLNRVKSASFPNTISGVIYQPWAFTAVNDGQINLTPNDTAYKAAQDALNGWDPTYGCIYYYNPATATSSWIWSRKIVLKIGKHNFAV